MVQPMLNYWVSFPQNFLGHPLPTQTNPYLPYYFLAEELPGSSFSSRNCLPFFVFCLIFSRLSSLNGSESLSKYKILIVFFLSLLHK